MNRTGSQKSSFFKRSSNKSQNKVSSEEEEKDKSIGSFVNSDDETFKPKDNRSKFDLEYHDFINSDFDLRKTYEDNTLNILNNLQREIISHPVEHQTFGNVYSKPDSKRNRTKTLFIDIGDTLMSVGLFQVDGQ